MLEKFKSEHEIDCKQEIIDMFCKYVKNITVNLEGLNGKHCGKEGHWLENQMNIKHNSNNKPDIHGYEMKKNSKKITFGDFSASEYLFSKDKPYINKENKWCDDIVTITKNEFIKIFGTQKPEKHNRYSWSGSCVPKYNLWNKYGQKLIITGENDIIALYSYIEDSRNDIKINFPEYLKHDIVIIAVWKNDKMRKHINDKFNQNGFIIMKKENKVYNKICFGKKFDYEMFINGIKERTIIFDSGMYVGNTRNYSQFRSILTNFWSDLIVEEH